MKKRLVSLVCLLTFLFATYPSIAVDSEHPERNFVINASLTKSILGEFKPQFVWKITDYFAVSVVGSVGFPWILESTLKLSDNLAKVATRPFKVGGGVGALFMPFSQGLNDNFHIEPRLIVQHERAEILQKRNMPITWDLVILSSTLNVGWHWIYNNGVFLGLDLFAGWEFAVKGDITGIEKEELFFSQALGFIPGGLTSGIDFRLGYAW